MQYYGGSTVEINLSNIKKNTEKIIARCPGYDYRFGVVKAEAYGHSLEAVQAVLDGGCNYLAVSSLDEAVRIRTDYDSVPILAFFPIDVKYADVYEKYSITASVDSAESLCVLKERNIKVHIKADTGMNRFGFKDKKNFAEAVHTAASYGILEGAYTHLYKACNRDITQKQTSLFKSFIDEAGSVKIPVIGMGGISNWQDAVEFLLAGATAIQIGTANFIDPCTPIHVIEGIESYLEKEGFKSVQDIIGII